MKLEEYLKEQKESENAFAVRAGISQPTIWRIIRDKVNLNSDTAMKIEKATNGKVKILELLYPDEAA